MVEHFAGKVCYATKGFIEKNTDELTVDCELALGQSTMPLLQACFAADGAGEPPAPKKAGSLGRVGSTGVGGRKKKTVAAPP